MPEKFLIVNADDFGFTRDVNDGIIDAHRNGILTATTLMANGAAFDHAVTLAQQTPTLDIGCHLVLVGGPSLPQSVAQLIAAIAQRKVAVYDEMKRQIEKILSRGLRLTHLDTHKHTHLLPPVLSAVARLSAEFGIPWVRRPFDFPLNAAAPFATQAANAAMRMMKPRFRAALANCRTTEHFAGFRLTGSLRTPQLVQLIRGLPPGITEFMCHPGYCRDELRAARTRLKESREEELLALTSQEAREALADSHIRLTNYTSQILKASSSE